MFFKWIYWSVVLYTWEPFDACHWYEKVIFDKIKCNFEICFTESHFLSKCLVKLFSLFFLVQMSRRYLHKCYGHPRPCFLFGMSSWVLLCFSNKSASRLWQRLLLSSGVRKTNTMSYRNLRKCHQWAIFNILIILVVF